MLKVIIEVVSSVIRRSTKDNNCVGPLTPKMMIQDQSVSFADTSVYNEQDSHFVLNIGNDHDSYVRNVTESSDGLPTSRTDEEEDDDDLLKEDINNWDIFDDHHKFQLREQKLREKKAK